MKPTDYIDTDVTTDSELIPDSASSDNTFEASDLDGVATGAPRRGLSNLDPSTKRLLWFVFGAACILALALPAAYVYLGTLGGPTPSSDVVIVPVIKDGDTSSSETTKTVTPEPTKDEVVIADKRKLLGEEYEDWDYQSLGRNIIAPVKGQRIFDSQNELNPKYEDVYLDTLDIEHHAAEIARLNALPTVSGRTPASPMPDTDGANPGVTFTAIKLTGIGTSNGQRVAVFSVDGSTHEAGVGVEIGTTGWAVTSISNTTVVISDGTASRTLVLPNGSK